MAQQYSGATKHAVNFSFTSTALGITGYSTGFLLQSASQKKNADVYEVRGVDGNVVQRTFYNFNDEATLEAIITSTADQATAITNTTAALKTPGTIVDITECNSMPSLVATTWQTESGVEISGSITDAKKCVVTLKKHAGITQTNA